MHLSGQIGANATDDWKYAKSYVQFPAYKHYTAFLAGYSFATRAEDEKVEKINNLRVR